MEASSGGHNIPKIMTFTPTWEEFKDFNKYIEHVESLGAHKAGVCKIIPPKEWVPRRHGYDDLKVTIPAPIQQVVHGKQGLYTQFNLQRKSLGVKEYEVLANNNTYKTPRHTDYEDLERRYWKNISFVNPIYGADVSGSLTDEDQDSWNIQKLGSILDCLGDDYGIAIEGVNTAYLYFGMWKTTFAWHTEDMDLYSINYIHFGAPKRWYAIPPEHGRRLERLAAGFFPENYEQCPAFLRHKMSLISPTILKRYSIPYDTIVQEEGQIIITFPYGYHTGFNHGFNCAESTNFASLRWIEYGKRCLQCHCRKDSVKIDMGAFVKRFQPKLYDLWKVGKDIGPHPEDDRSKLYNHHHNVVNSTSFSKRSGQSTKTNGESTGPVIVRHSRTDLKRATAEQTDAASSDSPTASVKPVKTEASVAVKPVETEASVAVKPVKTDPSVNGKVKKRPNGFKHKQSNGSNCDTKSGSDQWTSADTNTSCSEMDAVTDVSDALTDVEPEAAGSQSSTDTTTQLCSDAQTHTRPCKPKKRKISSDDCTMLRIDTSWAKSLTKLWRFNKPDFEAEKKYNTKMSQREPFCAVCSILNRQDAHLQMGKLRSRPPSTSVPLLPQSCFIASEEWEMDESRLRLPTKPRPLLICMDCQVCVHDTCYGVKFLPNGPKHWRCSRCVHEVTSVDCALCCIRGGALKPTADGKWAHIVCAIANTEVSFRCVSQREPVLLAEISRSRQTLKCTYCGIHSYQNGKDRFGKCVQCTSGQCSRSFHLTCAKAAGLKIDIATWPLRLYMTCTRHSDHTSRKHEDLGDRPALKVNDEVYARNKNGRYYHGELVHTEIRLYYCVLFEDNSSSKDTFPEDILNYPTSDGTPPLGGYVQVKWTDGLVYQGHFQGTRSVKVFSVAFEDGSVVQVERDQLYSIHEQLPMHVQRKLEGQGTADRDEDKGCTSQLQL